jgi:hypothetical protein
VSKKHKGRAKGPEWSDGDQRQPLDHHSSGIVRRFAFEAGKMNDSSFRIFYGTGSNVGKADWSVWEGCESRKAHRPVLFVEPVRSLATKADVVPDGDNKDLRVRPCHLKGIKREAEKLGMRGMPWDGMLGYSGAKKAALNSRNISSGGGTGVQFPVPEHILNNETATPRFIGSTDSIPMVWGVDASEPAKVDAAGKPLGVPALVWCDCTSLTAWNRVVKGLRRLSGTHKVSSAPVAWEFKCGQGHVWRGDDGVCADCKKATGISFMYESKRPLFMNAENERKFTRRQEQERVSKVRAKVQERTAYLLKHARKSDGSRFTMADALERAEAEMANLHLTLALRIPNPSRGKLVGTFSADGEYTDRGEPCLDAASVVLNALQPPKKPARVLTPSPAGFKENPEYAKNLRKRAEELKAAKAAQVPISQPWDEEMAELVRPVAAPWKRQPANRMPEVPTQNEHGYLKFKRDTIKSADESLDKLADMLANRVTMTAQDKLNKALVWHNEVKHVVAGLKALR